MDIMELGAIGEFVSGIAVIGSLIFVGLQVRQNTKTLRQAGRRQASLQNQQIGRMMADYPEESAVGFDRLGELSVADRWRFDMLWGMYLQGMEQTIADEREGLQSPEYAEPYRQTMREVLTLPGGRRWWDERRNWFSTSFQNEVDQLREQASRVKPGDMLSKHYVASA